MIVTSVEQRTQKRLVGSGEAYPGVAIPSLDYGAFAGGYVGVGAETRAVGEHLPKFVVLQNLDVKRHG